MTVSEIIGVRPATSDDIPFMEALGREMFQESRYAERYTYDLEAVIRALCIFTNTPSCIALVSAHGFFLGEVNPHWFARELKASDCILFVSKEHRHSREGIALLKAYMVVAKEMGAREIHISNSTGINPERIERLYEHMGFQRIGGNFVMEVGDV